MSLFEAALARIFMDNDSEYEDDISDDGWEPDSVTALRCWCWWLFPCMPGFLENV